MELNEIHEERLNDALLGKGLRATRQRELIYKVIIHSNHPTADEVYMASKKTMPSISLATVYNCLETLVECGLIRPFNFDREATRYDPDLSDHAHFQCRDSGDVFDIPLQENVKSYLKTLLPEHFELDSVELAFKGRGPRHELEQLAH